MKNEKTTKYIKYLDELTDKMLMNIVGVINSILHLNKYKKDFCHTINCEFKKLWHLEKKDNEYKCSCGGSGNCIYINKDGSPYWDETLIEKFKALKVNRNLDTSLRFIDPFKITIALIKHKALYEKNE